MHNRYQGPCIGHVTPFSLNPSQTKQLEQSGLPIHPDSRLDDYDQYMDAADVDRPRLGISMLPAPGRELPLKHIRAIDLWSQGFDTWQNVEELGISISTIKQRLDEACGLLGSQTVGQVVARLTVDGVLPANEVKAPERITFHQMISLAYVALFSGTQRGMARRLHVTHMAVKHSINRATASSGSSNKEQALRGLFAARIFFPVLSEEAQQSAEFRAV